MLGALLLGTAEVFADNAASTLTPMLVAETTWDRQRPDHAGFLTVNQLAGPPIGAALFAAGLAWPFARTGGLVPLGRALVSRLGCRDGRDHGRARGSGTTSRRGCAGCGTRRGADAGADDLIFNITFGAAWSVLVLYATERLGMGAVGFGLLSTVAAVGGLIGTRSYGWLARQVSLGNVMRTA